MVEPGAILWLNGTLCAAAAARIDPADRGLLLGDGLFETLAVRGGQPCDVARHFARLRAGAALLRLALPFDASALQAALDAVIAANALRQGGLRLTLTRGTGPRGLLPPSPATPTAMISAFAMPQANGPISVILARSVRRDEDSPLTALKTLNYLPNILARLEAAERGADDALLLNRAGRVAASTVGNVFLKRDGEWLTPPLADGALPGIRRARLIDAGKLHEAPIDPSDLASAAGLCLGNVLALRPVARIGTDEIAMPEAEIAALAEI